MSMENDGGIILTVEIRRTQRKACPNAILFSTNPTWTDLGSNPGLRGERPATNRLSHGHGPSYIVLRTEVGNYSTTVSKRGERIRETFRFTGNKGNILFLDSLMLGLTVEPSMVVWR
jgi:hypothetical protein